MYENGQGHLTLFCIVFVWLRGRPSTVRSPIQDPWFMYQNRLGPSGGIYYPNFVPCFVYHQLNKYNKTTKAAMAYEVVAYAAQSKKSKQKKSCNTTTLGTQTQLTQPGKYYHPYVVTHHFIRFSLDSRKNRRKYYFQQTFFFMLRIVF